MKQIITALICITLANHTIAQDHKWAIKAGYNYTSGRVVYGGIKQPVNGKSGFGVAGMVKIPFDGVLHFSPYVGYNMAGFVVTPNSGSNKKEDFTIHYFTITPALSADIPIGENTFVISGGPYLGLTKFGRIKTTDASNNTTNEKITFGYGGYGMFDLGLTAGIGYHFNKMFVEANYTPGLTSINNNEELDGKNLRNRTFSLNIGYYFR